MLSEAKHLGSPAHSVSLPLCHFRLVIGAWLFVIGYWALELGHWSLGIRPTALVTWNLELQSPFLSLPPTLHHSTTPLSTLLAAALPIGQLRAAAPGRDGRSRASPFRPSRRR